MVVASTPREPRHPHGQKKGMLCFDLICFVCSMACMSSLSFWAIVRSMRSQTLLSQRRRYSLRAEPQLHEGKLDGTGSNFPATHFTYLVK